MSTSRELKIVEADSSRKSTPNADVTAGAAADTIVLRRCLVSCITKYKSSRPTSCVPTILAHVILTEMSSANLGENEKVNENTHD